MSYIQRHNLQKFPPDYEMAGADCDIPWHGEKSITPLFGCGDGGSNLLIKVQLQATAERKREGLSLLPCLISRWAVAALDGGGGGIVINRLDAHGRRGVGNETATKRWRRMESKPNFLPPLVCVARVDPIVRTHNRVCVGPGAAL